MLNTLDYSDVGTTMKKRYVLQINKGKEIIYVDGEAITINSSQKWFWTDEWQAGEKAVDAYIKNGDIEEFASSEEFLSSLKE